MILAFGAAGKFPGLVVPVLATRMCAGWFASRNRPSRSETLGPRRLLSAICKTRPASMPHFMGLKVSFISRPRSCRMKPAWARE